MHIKFSAISDCYVKYWVYFYKRLIFLSYSEMFMRYHTSHTSEISEKKASVTDL
jgi:hypothetical protein